MMLCNKLLKISVLGGALFMFTAGTLPAASRNIEFVDRLSFGNFRGVQISGQYAYLLGIELLTTYDITVSTMPKRLNTLPLVKSKIYASGKYMYAWDNNGFVTLDISTPSIPVIIGNCAVMAGCMI